MKKFFAIAVLFLFLPLVSHAQSNVATFSLTASALGLPGNHQTVSGTVNGLAVTLSPNFDLREDNLVPGVAGQLGFFGGFNYRLPVLSTMLNNASSTLNGYSFQFYLTGSAGVTRISDASGNTAQHYAALAGIGANYKLSSGGMWTLGFEARAARLPGMASGWTAVLSLGPSIHW